MDKLFSLLGINFEVSSLKLLLEFPSYVSKRKVIFLALRPPYCGLEVIKHSSNLKVQISLSV
jgi:hypothetical protein